MSLPSGRILAFAMLGALTVAALAQKAVAATIYVDAPGTLDQAGATYLLTQDVSAPGTAFTILARGITLDLQGHTVTYNTAPSETPMHGIQVGTADHWLNMDSTGLRIRNGGVVQGAGGSNYGDAIYLRETGPQNVEISGLNIAVQGNSAHAIAVFWGRSLNIHDNAVSSTITAIASRYAYDGYAMHLSGIDGLSVTNNRIVGGHGGVALSGVGNATVSGNDISHHCLAGNGYGVLMWNSINVTVTANAIHSEDGCGILVDNEHQDVDVSHNTIDVQMRPMGEGYNTWGIKSRTWSTSGNPRNLRVHDNTIRVATGEGYMPCASGIGVYSGCSNQEDEYYNNDIIVVTRSPTTKAEGIKVAGDKASLTGVRVYGNRVASNSVNIHLATEDGPGPDGVEFVSNTLVKGENAFDYHTLAIGCSTFGNADAVFLDAVTENGATMDSVAFPQSGGAPYSYYVKWFLDVAVVDDAGNPVAGATVAAQSSRGAESLLSMTDTAGRTRFALTQYYRNGITFPTTSEYLTYTPHSVTVSMAGYQSHTEEVVVDRSKAIEIMLARDPRPQTSVTLLLSTDRDNPRPGDIITYTITYTNDGPVAVQGLRIVQPVPQRAVYLPGSACLNGAAVSPDPYSNGAVSIGVGGLAPGASGRLTFRARVR